MAQHMATEWIQSYACKKKTSQDLWKFLDREEILKVENTDAAGTAWCCTRGPYPSQPKIKTVVKCIEDGDFFPHERPVCVPETCVVRI